MRSATEGRHRSIYANVTSTLALVVALGGVSYAASALPAHSVGTRQLKDGAVTTPKLYAHAVSHSKIRLNAVTGADVAKDSLSLKDLVGVDVQGTIQAGAGAVAAHSCLTTPLTVGGARVGQLILLTFVGNVPAPQGLTFEPIKVSSANNATMRFCNPTNAPSPAFSNVGVRVVTFG
jgi:hypothetical protein